MSSASPTSTEPVVELDEGGHDRFSHIVRKDAVERSAVTGEPVHALCGKVWVPRHNPDNYPVCHSCIEALDRLHGAGAGAN